MTERTITFKVDVNLLFDALGDMNGDTAPLGARMVSALLAEPGMADRVGMACYGVEVV